MYSARDQQVVPARLPDSEICGSTVASTSPQLFAAVHVLHRLSTPRHPPRALSSFSLFPKARIDDSRSGFVARGARSRCSPRLPTVICGIYKSRHVKRDALCFLGVLFDCQRTSWLLRCARARLRARNFGGADRDRTDDLRLAKPALSQLSYSPLLSESPCAFAGGPS
jgi:hypothetical protein